MDKSHIKHTVGLIQYEVSHIIQMDISLIHQIQQTSWSGDQYVDSFMEHIYLRTLVYSSEDNHMTDWRIFGIVGYAFANLQCQFTGRCQYQGFDTLIPVFKGLQMLNNGNGKCSGLSSSGLRTA